MKEDFLHYLWKYKKFNSSALRTNGGQSIEIVQVGMHNHLAGPDFSNAQLRIDGQLWAGNVELHIKSSQWYAHGHEQDCAYDNVILHVVWEDDISVYNLNDDVLPTLVLKNYVPEELLQGYRKLFYRSDKGFINCEQDFSTVPENKLIAWLERLYLERLERKVNEIDVLLKDTQNDWEAVLFNMLARNFGTKINGAAFAGLARSIPFKVIRKEAQRKHAVEALLLGQAGLLPEEGHLAIEKLWKTEFQFLKLKYDLGTNYTEKVQFFRLRPPNFPTIRLSQLAVLYETNTYLFSELMQAKKLKDFHDLMSIKASAFWDTHYIFGKVHKPRAKKISTAFINLLLINTVIPLKFAYMRSRNMVDTDRLLELIASIPAEKNSVVNPYFELRKLSENALITQALLQLKNNYCDPNYCLNCRVGNFLIQNH